MRSAFIVALGLAALPSPGRAQLVNLPTIGSSWVGAGYPKLFYTSRNRLTAGVYYEQIRPPGFADWDNPPPYRGKLSLDAQISASGSRHLIFDSRFPSLVPGWRFVLTVAAQRSARENYFGIGNDTEFLDENVGDAQPHFYRADTRRLFARGEVQRHLVSGLRLLAGFHAERWRIDTLSGPTLLALDANPVIGQNTGELTARFGLVFDTRDDEVTPTRGVLLQTIVGIADSSVGGDVSYTRTTLSAAAYVPVTEVLVVAGRVVAQAMSGSPPLGSLGVIESADRPYRGVGGRATNRGFLRQRFLGTGTLLGNLDLRYRVFGTPRLAAITLIGFLDAGRVFHEEDLRLTFDDLHVSGGAGAVATVGRAGILGLTLGISSEGLHPKVHTGWTF